MPFNQIINQDLSLYQSAYSATQQPGNFKVILIASDSFSLQPRDLFSVRFVEQLTPEPGVFEDTLFWGEFFQMRRRAQYLTFSTLNEWIVEVVRLREGDTNQLNFVMAIEPIP